MHVFRRTSWSRPCASCLLVLSVLVLLTAPGGAARDDSKARRFRPDRILVKPKSSVRAADLDKLHAAGGGRMLRTYKRFGRLQVVRLRRGADVKAEIKRYLASVRIQ